MSVWTFAQSFGSGPNTTYLLFDAVRGWHMHDYPYHIEDPVSDPYNTRREQ